MRWCYSVVPIILLEHSTSAYKMAVIPVVQVVRAIAENRSDPGQFSDKIHFKRASGCYSWPVIPQSVKK